MRVIKAILWDCDGVLQHPNYDWASALDALGGPGFGMKLFEAELPALRGEATLQSVIEELVITQNLACDPQEVLDLWAGFEPDEDAWAVVDACRALGVTSVLATNQQDFRIDLMRGRLGYDDRVDHAYYSSEVGHMKPSREFFAHILADLAVPPEDTLFVDDSAANIASARALGLRTIHHEPASGAVVLRQEVTEFIPNLPENQGSTS